MNELWRGLKVGDMVRLVAWPQELYGDRMHASTLDLYMWLIKTGEILTIENIDDWGLPYGKICRTVEGVEYSEYLALNHRGVEVVERRPV